MRWALTSCGFLECLCPLVRAGQHVRNGSGPHTVNLYRPALIPSGWPSVGAATGSVVSELIENSVRYLSVVSIKLNELGRPLSISRNSHAKGVDRVLEGLPG